MHSILRYRLNALANARWTRAAVRGLRILRVYKAISCVLDFTPCPITYWITRIKWPIHWDELDPDPDALLAPGKIAREQEIIITELAIRCFNFVFSRTKFLSWI